MKSAITNLKETHNKANEVVNNMRSNQQNESIIPSWLVDIYKKSGIVSIIVTK